MHQQHYLRTLGVTQMATKPTHRKGWVFCLGSVTLGSHKKRGSSNTPDSRLPWNMAPPGINEQRMAEKSSILKTFYQRRMWCCNSCVLEGLYVHGSRFKITRVTGFIAGKKVQSDWCSTHPLLVSIYSILSTMILSGKLAAVLRQWLVLLGEDQYWEHLRHESGQSGSSSRQGTREVDQG